MQSVKIFSKLFNFFATFEHIIEEHSLLRRSRITSDNKASSKVCDSEGKV